MVGPKTTTTRIGHLYSSTKNMQTKKQKRYNLMTKSLLSNKTSNRFEFIMAPNHGKTCGLGRRKGTKTLPSGKSKTVDNMLL